MKAEIFHPSEAGGNVLHLSRVRKSYAAQTILDDVSFVVNACERVGLIGRLIATPDRAFIDQFATGGRQWMGR